MDDMKGPMKSILDGMGRAAREGRARRFTKRPAKGVDVSVGEVTLDPTGADVEVDPVKQTPDMSDDEMNELASELSVQR